MQEASSTWGAGGKRRCRRQTVLGGAEGKQWVSGGAQGREWVSGGTGGRLLAQDSEKNLCDDPFQTVPGSIPGSCIQVPGA